MNHLCTALRGSMTALATPFKDGLIDEAAFAHLCEGQITGGTAALVVCGSTGEAAALQPDEQASLIRLAVATVNGRVPVIAGRGGLFTEDATLQLSGDDATAAAYRAAGGVESNPVPLKAALAMPELARSEVWPPLIRATEATVGRLANVLVQIMQLEASVSMEAPHALAG